ncbi:MAG: 2-oxoacid:acceptor oxidoreductase subunit alpha [Candidatus Shapirobacteria bacterium]|jgi:2-oxoglutarate ferredoxin oxidoreductase subunit alpha
MPSQVFTIKIAAPAGLGVKSGGQLLSKALVAHGFNIKDYNEYPSLVRGGHNTYQVSACIDKIYAPHFSVDLFFSVQSGHWQPHVDEFHDDSLIFGDEPFENTSTKGHYINLPIKELSTSVGNNLVGNTICLGVAAFLLGLSTEIAKNSITSQYGKNAEINHQAFNVGYTYAKNNYSQFVQKLNLPKVDNKNGLICDGNESLGWGFLQSGGNFYAAYPMTPATGILHFLAEKQKDYKLTVLHPEDEIAVANIGAGAAFAGARVAVGTSGGGFVLMDEAISFCGIAEIGMVYYLVSRPGPATGLPTWTAQGDLLHAIYAGHGEFPKIVLAPGSHQECFDFSALALNLAAQLQTPIIVLSDKYLGESCSNVADFSKSKVAIEEGSVVKAPDNNFRRYSLKTQSGVSPLTLPGTVNGEFLSNSYEHDERGFSTELPEMSKQMMEKRMTKLKTALDLLPGPMLYGNTNAKKLIISWGSTTQPVLEALKNLPDYAFLQIRSLWPIGQEVSNIVEKYQSVAVIEANQTGQLTTLLKSQFNFHPTSQILKFNGRPFYPEEIAKLLTL